MTAPRSLPPPADKTAASPGEGASTPIRCSSCGHVTIPALRCANPDCRHLDVFHDLPAKKTVRTACSVSTGPRAARCACKSFTTDIPEGLPE